MRPNSGTRPTRYGVRFPRVGWRESGWFLAADHRGRRTDPTKGAVRTLSILALLAVAACGVESSAPGSASDLATPTFTGAAAAGACAEFPDEVVHITFERDVPHPRCAFVRGSQKLRLTNHFDARVVATLGRWRLAVPAGGTVLEEETFGENLAPGGHLMTTDLYEGDTYTVEIRYEEPPG